MVRPGAERGRKRKHRMLRLEKRILAALVVTLLALAPACQSSRGTGTGVGVGIGAGIGALIDDGNSWRGAAIGGAVGGLLGYAVGDSIEREREAVAYEAYHEDRVIYRDYEDGDCGERYRLRAEPSPQSRTRVITTVMREDPRTGEWVVVSEEEQDIE